MAAPALGDDGAQGRRREAKVDDDKEATVAAEIKKLQVLEQRGRGREGGGIQRGPLVTGVATNRDQREGGKDPLVPGEAARVLAGQ
jgi:hypothetical protein